MIPKYKPYRTKSVDLEFCVDSLLHKGGHMQLRLSLGITLGKIPKFADPSAPIMSMHPISDEERQTNFGDKQYVMLVVMNSQTIE